MEKWQWEKKKTVTQIMALYAFRQERSCFSTNHLWAWPDPLYLPPVGRCWWLEGRFLSGLRASSCLLALSTTTQSRGGVWSSSAAAESWWPECLGEATGDSAAAHLCGGAWHCLADWTESAAWRLPTQDWSKTAAGSPGHGGVTETERCCGPEKS